MPKVYKLQTTIEKTNTVIYGYEGVGKTLLAATAGLHPDMSDVLVLNVEGGMTSAIGLPNIRVVDVRCAQDLDEVLQALIAKDPPKEYKGVQTVVIDSITELQTVLLTEIASNDPKAKSPDDIHLAHYGKNTAHMKRMTRLFRDLPINVVVTALVRNVYPPTATDVRLIKPVEVMPALTEKLAASVMGYVDNVWYMYVDEGQRYLLTQPSKPYRAKTRGLAFAQKLGKTVRVRDLVDPDSTGHDLATIRELQVQNQGD
jgi:phage nucleotide-binding protein